MGEIYCLYSSEDGIPRYVGMTEWEAEKRWKKHLADALDLVDGRLYDWMREVARRGYYVGYHVLQSGIIPAELDFYERYWMGQFTSLFNVRENATPANEATETAQNVIVAIKAKLIIQDHEDQVV